jgi:hypothetical protein
MELPGFLRHPLQLLEDRAESAARAVESPPRRYGEATEDTGYLGGRETLPLRQQQDFAIAPAKAALRGYPSIR